MAQSVPYPHINTLFAALLTTGCLTLLAPPLRAQDSPTVISNSPIVVNELVAAQTDRLLRWPAPEPTEEPEFDPRLLWTLPDFNASQWLTGPGGIGYGDGDDATDVADEMYRITPSLYIRRVFQVDAQTAGRNDPLRLVVDYDDGFIAYINGVEVARSSTMGEPGQFFSYNDPALGGHEAVAGAVGIEVETYDLAIASELLKEGDNVLAIQVHNQSTASSDLTILPNLEILGLPSMYLVTQYDIWQYFVGLSEPAGVPETGPIVGPKVGAGPAWYELAYDASEWETSTALFREFRGPSLYIRHVFDLSGQSLDPEALVKLSILYRSGFVAYLNGVEVARRNLGAPGGFVYYDQPAYNEYRLTEPEEWTLGLAGDLLDPGQNILGIQVHQESERSTYTHAVEPELTAGEILIPSDAEWQAFAGVHEPSGGLADWQNEFSDWIELKNLGTETVSLLDWSITDDPANIERWIFPDVDIQPGGHLLLRASGKFHPDPEELHLPFKLDGDGDFLGIYDNSQPRQVMWAIQPELPQQLPFYSWGRHETAGQYVYFDHPTPGKPNLKGDPSLGIVDAPQFSHGSGFYETDLQLALATSTGEAVIRYTLDGTEPTSTTGELYTAPISLTESSAIRARAFREGWIPSPITTHTFLLRQEDFLKKLPALSVVTDWDKNLFNPYGIGAVSGGQYLPFNNNPWEAIDVDDFNNFIMHGRFVERPVNVELINPDGTEGFQEDCGIRIAGSEYARARYVLDEDNFLRNGKTKMSFRLYFRGDYGKDELEYPLFKGLGATETRRIKIRGGHNDPLNPFIKDEYIRRLFLNTGQTGSRGTFVHLYINGEYKGYYNPVERMDEHYFERTYDSPYLWDVMHIWEVRNGSADRWNALRSFAIGRNLSDYENYRHVEDELDVINYIDYLLVNIYSAMWDWPGNNFVMAAERSKRGKFRFYVWDAEGGFGTHNNHNVYHNTFTSELLDGGSPASVLYQQLRQSPEFRLQFADRIQKHFFGDGALTYDRLLQTYEETKAEVVDSVEDRNSRFDDTIKNSWLAQRRDVVFSHFRQQNLWPDLQAPILNPNGGPILPGQSISISNPNDQGQVFYSLDGTDPREHGTGYIPPTAQYYSGPIPMPESTLVRARVWTNSGWSPLAEAVFQTAVRPGDILITEFLANAYGNDDDKEWIELYNTTAAPIRINGWLLADNRGEEHLITSDDPVIVPAQGYLVLGSNPRRTENGEVTIGYSYGDGFTLSNEGDEIILMKDTLNIHSVAYGLHYIIPRFVQQTITTPNQEGYALGMADDYTVEMSPDWAYQSRPYGDGGERGTPGAPNDQLAPTPENTWMTE